MTGVADGKCESTTKPLSEEACNGTKSCDVGVWFTGPWSKVC